jgi:hypothetical protein
MTAEPQPAVTVADPAALLGGRACGVLTLEEQAAASVMVAATEKAAVATTSGCVRHVIVAP